MHACPWHVHADSLYRMPARTENSYRLGNLDPKIIADDYSQAYHNHSIQEDGYYPCME